MAEGTWVLNDSDPSTLAQGFETAPTEATWTLNDSDPAALAMTFAAAPAAWTVAWWGGPLSILMVAAGGQFVSVGLAAEDDSAFAVGRLKTKAVGLNTEADSVLLAGHSRRLTVGLVTETDSVLAAGRTKSKLVGLNLETDSVLKIVTRIQVGINTETDTAFAVGRLKTRAVALLTETDSVLLARAVKSLAVGQPFENDSAFLVSFTGGGGGPPVVTDPWYEGKTIYPLPSTAGLVEWVDYIPVKANAANPGRFDQDGSFPVIRVLTSTTGLVAWVDYLPVFVVNRTIPWTTEIQGYTPFQSVV